MHFDILTCPLPETVTINGKEYPINWDFRTGIELEKVIRSDETEDEKYRKMLLLYYPQIPVDLVAAVERIMWFYRCGEEEKNEEDTKQRYKRRRRKEPVCVFEQDSPYIYAAFLEQYRIDLTEVKSMHWWRFMALFESIGDNTKMCKIMYYRRASTSGMSKERRAFINEMKKLYQIRDSCNCKMTLRQRDQGWKEYVRKRFKEK